MSNAHVHKALEHVSRNGHHLSSTVQPYSTVQITGIDSVSRNIPVPQATSFSVYRRPGGTFVNSDNSLQSSSFNNSSNYLDFVVPKNGGMLESVHFTWTVKHTSAAVGDTLTPRPAFLQLDRYEIHLGQGSNVTSFVPGDVAHNLWINSVTDERYRVEASTHGMSLSDKAAIEPFPVAAGAGEEVIRTYRVQLKSIFDNSRLFLPSIDGDVRVRIYLQEVMHDAKVGAGVISLTNAQLICDFVELMSADWNAQYALGKSATGVSHRFIDLHRSTHPFAVSSGTTITQVLSSHSSSYCAGLLVYFRSQNTNQQSLQHAITSMQLTDDKNAKLTEILSSELMLHKVFPTTGFAGNAVVSANATCYFLPFCMDLSASLHHGVVSGGISFAEARNKLEFTSSAALAGVNSGNIQLEVVSMNFSTLTIRGGKVHVSHS